MSEYLTKEEVMDSIGRMEHIPRDELIAMSNKEFIRYIKILQLQKEFS